ncbi:MAG: hypothetical protein ABEH43_10420, partial [Flavobacteriales bacterium]
MKITDKPFVDAGEDRFICNENDIQLNGQISGGTSTGEWSILTGDGSFTDSSDLNATYNVAPADTVNGTVELILTSTNNGDCLPVKDTVEYTFTPKPTVIADTSRVLCANNADTDLNGSVSGSTDKGVWSTSGTGVFSPDSTNLNATYLTSDSDTAAGSVEIILASRGACKATDSLTITYTPAPHVDVGPDPSVCKSNPLVDLDGNVSGATNTGLWSTEGSGTFSADTMPWESTETTDSLNGYYNASSNDTANGKVDLILKSTNNGDCLTEYDTLDVAILPPPVVTANSVDTACVNTTTQLDGDVSLGATEGAWSTNGDGIFIPDSTTIDAKYKFHPSDTGELRFILRPTNFSGCPIDIDTTYITVTPAPQVNVGPDLQVCTNNDTIDLNGNVFGSASKGEWDQWDNYGTGTFVPEDSILDPTFFPSDEEKDRGFARLLFKATDTGICNSSYDFVNVDIQQEAIVNAGRDTTICNDDVYKLNGSVEGVTNTGDWETLGDGYFTPDSTVLDPVYVPGSADTSSGNVKLVLHSTNNQTCLPNTDTLSLDITPIPNVDAGPDITVCENTVDTVIDGDSLKVVKMNGNVSGSDTTGVWKTLGHGAFSLQNNTTLDATYVLQPGDVENGSVQNV